MKYTVVWQPSAENELIELWSSAANREQVTQAADEIERILSTKPTELASRAPAIYAFLSFLRWRLISAFFKLTELSALAAFGKYNA
jgi:hypothetical protein